MYAYIKGTIVDISEDNVVLECNNIGYNISVSSSVISRLPGIGADIMIYTYTCVREDAFILYGFLTKDDLWIFKKLITVNGIGPKGALGILSTLSADDLRFAIMAGDAKAIAKAPGIGNKSAERIILDLKDKISKQYESYSEGVLVSPVLTGMDNGEVNIARTEAIEALVALGYSSSDSMKAVNKVFNENPEADLADSGIVLKLALKVIAR